MTALALELAYDGTDFLGFQRQRAGAGRTVQGELETALTRLTGDSPEALKVKAAGRTDAGVHASGQVIAFRTRRDWPPAKWVTALNAVLPPDVAVQGARVVTEAFEPRRHATGRSYRYRVLVRRVLDPLLRRTHHQVPELPMESAMSACLREIVGTHDFAAFRSLGSTPRGTVVTVTEAEVTRLGAEVFFTISAISFLYHMVRRLVGAALQVGQGILSPGDFGRYLTDGGEGLRPAPTAPAHGLILTHVSYPAPWGWD